MYYFVFYLYVLHTGLGLLLNQIELKKVELYLLLRIGENNACVQPYDPDESSQAWCMKNDTVSNTTSDRVLDIADASSEPGARITAWHGHGGSNQEWAQEYMLVTRLRGNRTRSGRRNTCFSNEHELYSSWVNVHSYVYYIVFVS